MEKEKATIYDFARMCGKYHYTNCEECPMWDEKCNLRMMDDTELDKANEIILNWCKEHPVKTRQDKFLKMFPNADLSFNYIDICPSAVDKHLIGKTICAGGNCSECKKEFWLAEVEE